MIRVNTTHKEVNAVLPDLLYETRTCLIRGFMSWIRNDRGFFAESRPFGKTSSRVFALVPRKKTPCREVSGRHGGRAGPRAVAERFSAEERPRELRTLRKRRCRCVSPARPSIAPHEGSRGPLGALSICAPVTMWRTFETTQRPLAGTTGEKKGEQQGPEAPLNPLTLVAMGFVPQRLFFLTLRP